MALAPHSIAAGGYNARVAESDESRSASGADASRSMMSTSGEGAAGGAVREYAPPEHCAYCGAELHPLFYFCLRCATPYKRIENVIPPRRPRRLTGEEQVALRAPNVAPLFWTYLAAVLLIAIVNMAAFDEDEPHFALFFADGVIILVTAIFAALYWGSLKVQFRRLGLFQGEAWVAVLLGLPLVLVINYFWHAVLPQWLGGLPDNWTVDSIERLTEQLGRPMLILSFCVVPAVTEEIAFRGLMQHWLGVAIGPLGAIVVASALFAAVHLSLYSLPVLFLVGVLLGWTKMKTQSLYPSMLIHFLHNLIVIELF